MSSNDEELIEFARSLARTPRVSGNEGAAVGLTVQRLRDLGFDHVETDAAGNAIGVIGDGRGPRLLIDGHIDSIPLHSEERWTRRPIRWDDRRRPALRPRHLRPEGIDRGRR